MLPCTSSLSMINSRTPLRLHFHPPLGRDLLFSCNLLSRYPPPPIRIVDPPVKLEAS